eukprot:TRINITY_DN20523_c1_g2_i1.p1 TRINITY_DN20523_c1_g2~~TRINITY_DN20523_c1_g2_i1.p1  ORF type:complete len:1006 (+),score=272.65 TRINITY_DN20523_c1_g2_i1:73-3018(+)
MTQALHSVARLVASGSADEAAQLLKNECSKEPVAAVAAARHTVLEAYIRQDKIESATSMVLEVLQSPGALGEQLQPQSLDLVLRALLQAQQHGRATEVLRAACAGRTDASAPSDSVFNSVLDASVRARAFAEAWDVLELVLDCRRKADKYFVSILTKSLESSSDKRWVRRGISLVDRFIDQQKEDVDEIVFNSLLNVLGHLGDMPKLQITLNKMNEYGVQPSAVTFGTVVKAYGRARDIDNVLRVWNQMRSRCLGVNPVTCGCVLDACVKCGCFEKAMEIFQEMKVQGLHKNTVLYATLIKGLAKIRDLATAMGLYQEMRAEQVDCNLVTFNSLMDVCVRCGDLATAAYFLQDMMQMGIEPDLITFSTLIKGYSHIGEVHKALALSKELKSRGLKCDEIMYNSLIDGCAKAQKVQEGLVVFQEMIQSRVPPSNITFSILVKLHCEGGQLDAAFQLVEEMYPKYRCMPGRIVYTVLLRCCTAQGGPALVRAAQLLLDLSSRKNSRLPDQVMVSSVILACVQHSDFQTAALLVREFTNSGSRAKSGTVGVDCLKTLFEALGSHEWALGSELIEYLRNRKGLPPSHIGTLEAALSEGRSNPGLAIARAQAEAAAAAGAIAKDAGDEPTSPTFGQPCSPTFGAPSPSALAGHHTMPAFDMAPSVHHVAPPVQMPPPAAPLPWPPLQPQLDPYAPLGFPHLPAYPPSPYGAADPSFGFLPQYNPSAAAAAAAAAAGAAYHQHFQQHMAGYAAAAAAAAAAAFPAPPPPPLHYPEASLQLPPMIPPPMAQLPAPLPVPGAAPVPPMLPAPEVAAAPPAMPPMSMTYPVQDQRPVAPPVAPPTPVAQSPAPVALALAEPPRPAPAEPPTPAKTHSAQARSPPSKVQAAAEALALTPLPAGPLTPSKGQTNFMATPPPAASRPIGTAEKAPFGKENMTPQSRNVKDMDNSASKMKGKRQTTFQQQKQQLRERAAALSAAQPIGVGRVGA